MPSPVPTVIGLAALTFLLTLALSWSLEISALYALALASIITVATAAFLVFVLPKLTYRAFKALKNVLHVYAYAAIALRML